MRPELAFSLLFLDILCTVSCGGQFTTFADLLTYVVVHICICSDVVNRFVLRQTFYDYLALHIKGLVGNMTHVCFHVRKLATTSMYVSYNINNLARHK